MAPILAFVIDVVREAWSPVVAVVALGVAVVALAKGKREVKLLQISLQEKALLVEKLQREVRLAETAENKMRLEISAIQVALQNSALARDEAALRVGKLMQEEATRSALVQVASWPQTTMYGSAASREHVSRATPNPPGLVLYRMGHSGVRSAPEVTPRAAKRSGWLVRVLIYILVWVAIFFVLTHWR